MKNYHGDLDYTKIRNCFTPLNEKEFAYCENDCLVLYYYIKFEKEHNFDVPLTYTGHVRQELKSKLNKSYNIKVKKQTSGDPIIYDRLCNCFAGGYTHANYFYSNKILTRKD